jgi:hypothetical protein
LLDLPRLVEDGEYLYERLKNVLPQNLEKGRALKAHAKLVDLSKVRTGPEIAVICNKATPEQKSKFLAPGIEYPSLENIDVIALKRAISDSAQIINAMVIAKGHLGLQRNSLIAARDTLLRERDENAQRTAEYERSIASIHASVCWRLSRPIRWLHGYARRANRVLLRVRSLAGRS